MVTGDIFFTKNSRSYPHGPSTGENKKRRKKKKKEFVVIDHFLWYDYNQVNAYLCVAHKINIVIISKIYCCVYLYKN